VACVAALAFAAPALALDIADASPPAGVVGAPYSFTFHLAPGSGSTGASWSIDSGALPPGLRLSSNDRSATVFGTPTQAGSFSFYLKVRDAPGPWVCCTEEEFTIVVEHGLVIDPGPELPAGNVGTAYGLQLTTSGGAAGSWTVAAGTLPAGMTLSADGALTGTPTEAALAQFTVRAVNGSRTAAKQLTLKVAEPIVVTAPPARTVKAGAQFLVAFAAKGGLAPYTWSAVNPPGGVVVNATTGQVTGSAGAKRPNPEYHGVSLATLQTWLAYWEGVKSGGKSRLAPGSKDTVEMAPAEISKLTKEIDTRTKPAQTKVSVGRFTLTLTVTDALGTTSTATTTVSVVDRPAILTAKLPVAHSGKRFTATLRTSGGAGPLKLRLAGAAPTWLRLVDGGTRLAGTPKLDQRKHRGVAKKRAPRTATYNVHLTAVDAIGQRSVRKLKLIVKS
jgi:hypothetical protein